MVMRMVNVEKKKAYRRIRVALELRIELIEQGGMEAVRAPARVNQNEGGWEEKRVTGTGEKARHDRNAAEKKNITYGIRSKG